MQGSIYYRENQLILKYLIFCFHFDDIKRLPHKILRNYLRN
jgi:hypothetical protein